MAARPSSTKLGVANEALSSRRSSRDSTNPAQPTCCQTPAAPSRRRAPRFPIRVRLSPFDRELGSESSDRADVLGRQFVKAPANPMENDIGSQSFTQSPKRALAPESLGH